MWWATISKDLAASVVPPNLRDYDRARVEFDWTKARRCLDGLPGGRVSTSRTRRWTGMSPLAKDIGRHCVSATATASAR